MLRDAPNHGAILNAIFQTYRPARALSVINPTALFVAALTAFMWLASPAQAAMQDDAYIAGYATSAIEHEFGLRDAIIVVKDGVVTVTTGSFSPAEQEKAKAAIARIHGVQRVDFVEEPILRTAPDPTSPQTTPIERLSMNDKGVTVDIYDAESKWLPHGLLFEPLHADPRWPRFSATYRRISGGVHVPSGFSGNFGETFALYRNKAIADGEWEFGIQAGVFSVLDLGKKSVDLVNADYRIGLISSYRSGRFSTFVRLMHQSSHLGDEFLLNNNPVRINLSYEEVDIKLSYELSSWLRVYGGGGALVRREPRIGVGSAQWGVELTWPTAFFGGKIRPVAYSDFQAHERSNWNISHSIMAGVQIENARLGDRRLQVLLEQFSGPSPDGQFYDRRVAWYGIGVHFFY
ncbi:MAG: DUF1207 domain-containing protein [Nitrospiraceae bacterium]